MPAQIAATQAETPSPAPPTRPPTIPDATTPQVALDFKSAGGTIPSQESLPSTPYAYVTLLTRDSYLPGVQCLARSLRRVGAQYPLVVMVTNTLSEGGVEVLKQEGCAVHVVPRLGPGATASSRYKLPLYGECWNKLHMWRLDRYQRLVYLDADMLVLLNIDAMFTLGEGVWAVPDCSFGRKTQAERDSCPLFLPTTPTYFNAGMVVVTPDTAEFDRFMHLLGTGAIEVGGYAEQDFLNVYYRNRWRPLPHTYNAQKCIRCHHPHMWRLADVAVLHYVDSKPWNPNDPANASWQDLNALWWEAFEGGKQEAEAAGMPVVIAPSAACRAAASPTPVSEQLSLAQACISTRGPSLDAPLMPLAS